MHAKKILATLTLASTATAMAACADPTTSTSTADATTGATTSTTSHYDVSSIPTVDEIAALVPDDIKKRGTLRNGASTGYAPAEYMDADGQTPIGYDIDINKALAKVMGLNAGETKHSEFPTIIPALGTKFDVGISSFTITSEREQQVNMVSYLNVGSAWGVAAGNPKNFDPSNPCGAIIAVQTGTAQEEYAATLSDKCVADGKDKITVMPHELQTDIATKLTGGRAEAETVGAILLPCVLTIGATVLVFYLIAMRSCLGILIMVASCLATAVVVSSAKQDILGAMVFGMTAISAIAPLLGPGPVEPPVLRIQALPG